MPAIAYFFNMRDLPGDAQRTLSFLHQTVHSSDVPVYDPDTLSCGAGTPVASLAHLNPPDEEPQQFRCQLINGGVPFGLVNEGAEAFSFFRCSSLF